MWAQAQRTDGNQFLWPVHGWVSATRTYPDGTAHNLGSADISCTHWTKVTAARHGVVSSIPTVSGTFLVFLDHENNYQTIYGHWSEPPDLVIGQNVLAGEELGTIGRTGIATSPHMHFGIMLSGVEVAIPGLYPGDWAQRGDYVPGDYAPLTPLSTKIDTHLVVAAVDQDVFALPDPTSAVVGTIARGTVLTVTGSGVGFFRVSAFAQDCWIPYSSTEPLPLGFDGKASAFGDHALAEVGLAGMEQLPFLSGIVLKLRAGPSGANALDRPSGNLLWIIKPDQLLTGFDVGEEGWIRIMDLSYPRLDGGNNLIPSRFAWVSQGSVVRVEDFSVGVGTRSTEVRDAPSLSGNVLATFSVAAPFPSSGQDLRTYTLFQCINNTNGWYELANWPSMPQVRAWVPGWKMLARR